MKNCNDTIGNRTRDLPACSAVPQPTAPPRAPTPTVRRRNETQTVTQFEIFITALVLHSFRLWLCLITSMKN